jgi:hypothetical protein
MGATKKFIWEKVGTGSKNNAADVKAVQQLLIAAGETIKAGDKGKWDDSTVAALQSFQTRVQKPTGPPVPQSSLCTVSR